MRFSVIKNSLLYLYYLQFFFSDISKKPQRKRKNCPLCSTRGLSKLSNHLVDSHGVDGIERKELLLSAEDYSMY